MDAFPLVLAVLLLPPAAAAADETAHPLRVTNERGTAVVFTAPATAATDYIINRHLLLDHLATQSPDAILEAQISFSRHLTSSQLMKALNGTELTIRTLNFGWDGQSGGFDLRSGESRQAGLARLHRYHGDFIKEMKQSRDVMGAQLQREGDRPGP